VNTTTNTNQRLRTLAEQALAAIAELATVPQGRCVDTLLDLLLATDDPIVRSTIMDRLRDLRFSSTVDADDMRADLEAVIAISCGHESIDVAWAERLLTCDCSDCLTVRFRTLPPLAWPRWP
jgi:hypothetical protein